MKTKKTKEVEFWALAKTLLVGLFSAQVILIMFWALGSINWKITFSPTLLMIGVVCLCYLAEWTFKRK